LDYFLRWVLRVSDEHVIAFTFFSTTQNELLRTSISDTYGVNSREFVVETNHSDNSFSVVDTAISQQKDLFGVPLDGFLYDLIEERLIDLSSSHICRHFLYFLYC